MIRACGDCAYYEGLRGMGRGTCRRMPTAVMKNAGEWCGEFSRALAKLEAKPARGRRLKEAAAAPTVAGDGAAAGGDA